MCWILHGALQGDVADDALDAINRRHACHIAAGTRHDLKNALLAENWRFRLTEAVCDCGTAVGEHDPDAEEIADLAGLIAEVGALPGAKNLSLCKTWGPRNKRQQELKLSELQPRQWLADLSANTLYTIKLQE